MSAAADREATLVEYLLGRLPESDGEGIEERLFADEEFREELRATADDLIHSYLAGTLSGDDRERFEVHFLASARHWERVAYIRDLLAAVKRLESPQVATRRGLPRALAPAWGLAAVITIAFAGGLLWRLLQPPALQVPRPLVTPSPGAPVAPSPGVSAGPAPLAEGRSAPPLHRDPGFGHLPSGEVQVVHLAQPSSGPVSVSLLRQARAVRVEVPVDGRGPSYDAVLSTEAGASVWRVEGLLPPAPGTPLSLELPVDLLTAARYVLRVEAEGLRGPGAPPPLVLEYSLDVVLAP